MTRQWEVANYNKFMLEKIISLTNTYYGDTEISSKDYLRWQYLKNPSGESVMKLAIKDNEVIGQYIVIPVRFNVSGLVVIGSLSLNTLVNPQFHGKGIFKILAKEVYQCCQDNNILFTYGFPNQNSFHGFTRSLGFKHVDVPLLIRVINPLELMYNRISDKKNIENHECMEYSFESTSINDIIISKIDKFGSEIDIAWESFRDNFPVMVIRDSKYLNWRYIDIPCRNYHILKAEYEGKICGYIVFRETYIKNIRCGMIVDLVVEKTSVGKSAGNSLVSLALKHFKKVNVSISGALMMKHTQEFNILRKNGFMVCPKRFLPQPFPLILRMHQANDKADVVENFDNWFITMGDYDVI